ncbi:MAG: hypothetical protein WD403_00465, partial [Pirellulales bacterium]
RPVMLVWGMRDWCFTPHFLERFLEFFPSAEVQRLDQAGHYVVEDAHEEIVPLVQDFLNRNPLERGRPAGQVQPAVQGPPDHSHLPSTGP